VDNPPLRESGFYFCKNLIMAMMRSSRHLWTKERKRAVKVFVPLYAEPISELLGVATQTVKAVI